MALPGDPAPDRLRATLIPARLQAALQRLERAAGHWDARRWQALGAVGACPLTPHQRLQPILQLLADAAAPAQDRAELVVPELPGSEVDQAAVLIAELIAGGDPPRDDPRARLALERLERFLDQL